MTEGGESNEVKLTRIEGKLDLSNLRHDQTEMRLKTVDDRLHSHGNRIGVLEAIKHLNEGERKGVAMSGRIMLVLCGALPVGLIAALLRTLGA
jgi:hypothetical protein